MLQLLKQLAAEEEVVGVETVLGTSTDLRLPERSLDWILLADVYHEMEAFELMLVQMRESLAGGGRVALLEYRKEDGSADHIRPEHTLSVREVLAEWKPAGFDLVELHEFLPSQHLFVLGRTGDRRAEQLLFDYDLVDAVSRGLVDVEALGVNDESLRIRMRRRGEFDLVVTAPSGLTLSAPAGKSAMATRRDSFFLLDDGGWHEATVRAVRKEPRKPSPGPSDRLGMPTRPSPL
jgi:hypothetical protein